MLTISSLLLCVAFLLMQLISISSAPVYTEKTFFAHPDEVLPIQPVQVYPNQSQSQHNGQELQKDSDVFFIKLHNRKSYRPKKHRKKIDTRPKATQKQNAKDIFYVKTLANGRFSHNRVKLYRLPEFNEISVFHKDNVYE